MKIFILTARAVYDHGVTGVYESRAAARKAAKKIWPETDGHHEFVILERELNKTYPNQFSYKMYLTLQSDPGELRLSVEKEPEDAST